MDIQLSLEIILMLTAVLPSVDLLMPSQVTWMLTIPALLLANAACICSRYQQTASLLRVFAASLTMIKKGVEPRTIKRAIIGRLLPR